MEEAREKLYAEEERVRAEVAAKGVLNAKGEVPPAARPGPLRRKLDLSSGNVEVCFL